MSKFYTAKELSEILKKYDSGKEKQIVAYNKKTDRYYPIIKSFFFNVETYQLENDNGENITKGYEHGNVLAANIDTSLPLIDASSIIENNLITNFGEYVKESFSLATKGNSKLRGAATQAMNLEDMIQWLDNMNHKNIEVKLVIFMISEGFVTIDNVYEDELRLKDDGYGYGNDYSDNFVVLSLDVDNVFNQAFDPNWKK